MTRLAGKRNLPVEYYILDVDSEGAIVGYIGERPVPGIVIDCLGHSYRYAGLAPRCLDGRLDVLSLKPGEWIVQPGLLYVSEDPVAVPEHEKRQSIWKTVADSLTRRWLRPRFRRSADEQHGVRRA